MSDLSVPYKIHTLPIACDTLILTVSPYHQVLHRHAQHPLQIYSLIRPHQQTHRIVILSDSYQRGKEVVSAIEEAKFQADIPSKLPEIISLSPKQDDAFPSLIESMISSFEKKKQWLEVKHLINKAKVDQGGKSKRFQPIPDQLQGKATKFSKKATKQLKIQEKLTGGGTEWKQKSQIALGSNKQWKDQLKGDDISLLQRLQQEQQLLQEDALEEKENKH